VKTVTVDDDLRYIREKELAIMTFFKTILICPGCGTVLSYEDRIDNSFKIMGGEWWWQPYRCPKCYKTELFIQVTGSSK
jgi:hypothetical protein